MTTELALAAAALPAGVRTAAVTGSNGKTTTCAFLHSILKAKHARAAGAAWLAGNGGGSLLDDAERVRPGDSVVWEVSSFQLEYLAPAGFRADAAVVTNFAPNHLDRHGTVAAYRSAKRGLLANLRPTDTAVLNAADADVRGWPTPARRVLFDTRPAPFAGLHNEANAAAAEAAARALGCTPDDIEAGLRTAVPPPHRLEFVCERAGVRFVDDSAATTPESLVAALGAVPGPVFLIAGGTDKGADFTAAAAAVAARTAGAWLIGTTGPALRAAILKTAPAHRSDDVGTLEAAFIKATAAAGAAGGGTVLLSPGCGSQDQFTGFEARGAAFAGSARGYSSKADRGGGQPGGGAVVTVLRPQCGQRDLLHRRVEPVGDVDGPVPDALVDRRHDAGRAGGERCRLPEPDPPRADGRQVDRPPPREEEQRRLRGERPGPLAHPRLGGLHHDAAPR